MTRTASILLGLATLGALLASTGCVGRNGAGGSRGGVIQRTMDHAPAEPTLDRGGLDRPFGQR